MRGRGLKQEKAKQFKRWVTSPAMRGRGLKHLLYHNDTAADQSPAMRGRGLKLCHFVAQTFLKEVARHARAWVET